MQKKLSSSNQLNHLLAQRPKKLISLIGLLFFGLTAFSQLQNRLKAGLGVNIPVAIPTGHNHAIGFGPQVSAEHFFGKRFSGTLSVAFNYYRGTINYGDYGGNEKSDKSFSLLPVLAGIRFYQHKFYLGSSAGLVFGTSYNTATNLALAPSLGFVNKHFDLSMQYVGIPQTFNGIPENTYLKKGGYSIVQLGIQYLF
jgi:hypothetical protein